MTASTLAADERLRPIFTLAGLRPLGEELVRRYRSLLDAQEPAPPRAESGPETKEPFPPLEDAAAHPVAPSPIRVLGRHPIAAPSGP